MVKMMMPATIREAAKKARLQELTLEDIFRKNKVVNKSFPMGGTLSGETSKAMVPVVASRGYKGGIQCCSN